MVALTFDGVNDRVTIPDAADLDLTTGMTLEAWVYPTTSGANISMVGSIMCVSTIMATTSPVIAPARAISHQQPCLRVVFIHVQPRHDQQALGSHTYCGSRAQRLAVWRVPGTGRNGSWQKE